MALHRISSFTYQVPNPDEVLAYYEEFGLTNNGDGSMSTVEGGKQLYVCLLYTSPSPRDKRQSRMPSSA